MPTMPGSGLDAGVTRSRWSRRPRAAPIAAAFVVLVAAFLILFRLDQRLLWVDEAETALLARSVLVHGVPTAYDGTNLISQEVGREFGSNYVWRWTPWLDKYVAAASFAVLGPSTFSARLPFALIGVLSVASLYPLALRLFADRWTGVLAMAFLALSVPFILHARQCRYYALIILATIWAVYFVIGVAFGDRGTVGGFIGAMTVIFHSNVLTFAATAVALVPFALLLNRDRPAFKRGLVAAAWIAALNGPFAIFLLQGKSGETLHPFATNLRKYLQLTWAYTLPVAALIVFVAMAWVLRRRGPFVEARSMRPFMALLAVPAVMIPVLSAAPWSFYRYTVGLLPLSALVLAFMSRTLLRWNRLGGALVAGSLLFTGLFHQISVLPFYRPRSNFAGAGRTIPACDLFFPLGNYLFELAHPYPGPMEQLVRLLTRNTRPGERVFASYGDLVLMFYTGLEVRGGQSGRSLEGWPDPDWVVIRGFFRFIDRPRLKADAERVRSWLNALPRERYLDVSAPWTDLPWDDIPEPDLHWFRVPESGRLMRVLRRRDGPEPAPEESRIPGTAIDAVPPTGVGRD